MTNAPLKQLADSWLAQAQAIRERPDAKASPNLALHCITIYELCAQQLVDTMQLEEQRAKGGDTFEEIKKGRSE
jgi:hypothetical protein